MDQDLEPVIGLEVHLELKTKSKMFCGCSADYFGSAPNTLTCPVCLGLPGSLPVPNQKAIDWTVLLGMALNCPIPKVSKFDRKHYFYPDLPKGFQISQYEEPLAINGYLKIPSLSAQPVKGIISKEMTGSKVAIRRVHLEEDTGKLIHTKIGKEEVTLIDFNRSGLPLVEIVTEPEIKSVAELLALAQELRRIVRYLQISSADMEKGQMRFEANVSLRRPGGPLPNYKVEIKNINSFRFLEQSVRFELDRQGQILAKGGQISQETRGWNEQKQETVSLRTKEKAQDYRYFPEPDIPPIEWNKKRLKEIKSQLPELPDQKRQRFRTWFRLPDNLVWLLTDDLAVADWYEEALQAYVQTVWPGIKVTKKKPSQPVALDAFALNLAKWLTNEVMRYLTSPEKIFELPIEAAGLAELLYLIEKSDLTQTKAKEILAEMIKSGKSARSLMKTLVVTKTSPEELGKIIDRVVSEHPAAVADYRQGKTQSLEYLIGQVMRLTKGQVEANQARKLLLERLSVKS